MRNDWSVFSLDEDSSDILGIGRTFREAIATYTRATRTASSVQIEGVPASDSTTRASSPSSD